MHNVQTKDVTVIPSNWMVGMEHVSVSVSFQ